MRYFYTLFLLLLALNSFAQNPAVIKMVGNTVLQPSDASQDAWENNGWNGKYFYTGTGTPTKLIVTDGTSAGTQYVADIGTGSIINTIPAQDFIYIITNRVVTTPSFAVVTEIWKSDGTAGGTSLVKTMDPHSFSAQGNHFTSDNQNERNYSVNGNIMIFGGRDATFGRELWRTDGTPAGTYMIKDIKSGSGDSFTSNFVRLNDGFVYFSAAAVGLGTTLWRTDGTTAGTTEIPVPNLTVVSNAIGKVNGKLIFYGNDNGVTGYEPWVSDGTVAGTFRLADINPGSANSSPGVVQNLQFRFNDKYCFFISQTAAGKTLWRTDGTIAGTIQLTPDGLITEDNFSGGGYSSIRNNGVYWIGGNTKLYFSDGTPAGTRLIRNNLNTAVHVYTYKGAGWFAARAGNSSDDEPWRTDGTSANTARALDVYPGGSGAILTSSDPFGYFELNGYLYFFATNAGGRQLFRYNGDMTFHGSLAGGRWRDSANWNSVMPPGITDTAYIGAGLTVTIDGANAYAGTLIMNSGSSVNLAAATDSLFVHKNLQGTSASGNGVVVLKNFNGDTTQVNAAFTAGNINTQGPVLLNNHLTVNNSFTLSASARLFTSNSHLVLTGTSSTITADANNYIVTNGSGGLTIQNIGTGSRTGNIVFPIGTTSYYNPVTIENSGVADAFTARVATGISNMYTGEVQTGGAYTGGAVNATWHLTEGIPGGSDATITLQWEAAQELADFNRAQSRLGHFMSGTWQLSGAGAATGGNPFTFTKGGYTGFSPFGILNNNAVLPLHQINLSVLNTGTSNRCAWTIKGDEMALLTLERSADGRNFTAAQIISFSPSGTVDDVMTTTGKTFYRLKAVTSNGSIKYSNVVWIDNSKRHTIAVFPTLFTNMVMVQNNTNENVSFRLYQRDGKLVLAQTLKPGTNSINTTSFVEGNYFYQVLSKNKVQATGQLVKQ